MRVVAVASFKAKNGQVARSMRTSYKNFLQQADVGMCSRGMRQLVDDKSVVICEQDCCKLIDKTSLSRGLLQAVSTSCNKSANDKLQQA